MVVERRGNKWCVIHCHGKNAGKIIACHDTKEEAEAQHRAIQASKHSHIKIEKSEYIDPEILEKFELGFINKLIEGLTYKALFKKLFTKVFRSFNRGYDQTQLEYDFERAKPDKLAIEDLKTRELILSQKTTDAMTGNLRFELLEGLKNHESIDQITARLDKIFDGVNTERIARTEILHSMNAGRYHAYERSGLVKYVMWKSANDKRVGADSKRLNGQIQPIGSPFIDPLTGKSFMFPPNRPQCRCSTIPLTELPDDIVRKNGLMYSKEV